MRKICSSIILFLTVVAITFTTPVSAQEEAIVLADISISDAQILNQDENNFDIEFAVINNEGSQTQIKYAVRLIGYGERGEQVILDEKVYDEELSVLEHSSISRTINYIAPDYLSGEYQLWLFSTNKSGLPLGLSLLGEVTLNGNDDFVEIVGESCFIEVEGSDTRYTLGQGVDIQSDENLIGYCDVVNHYDEAIELVAYHETFLRTSLGTPIATDPTENDQTINLEAGETSTEMAFYLPKAEKPQAYDVNLVLTDQNGKEVSNKVVFHYVLQGASATIQNISLDSDSYKRGDVAVVSIPWTGSADSFSGSRRGSGTDTGALVLSVQLVSGDGFACSEVVNKKLSKEDYLETKVELGVMSDCISPQVAATIKTIDGTTLYRSGYTGDVQKSIPVDTSTDSSPNKLIFLALGLIILIGVVVMYISRVRNNRISEDEGIDGDDGTNNDSVVLKSLFFVLVMGISILVPTGDVEAYTFTLSPQPEQDLYFTVNLDKTAYHIGDQIKVTGTVGISWCSNTGNDANVRLEIRSYGYSTIVDTLFNTNVSRTSASGVGYTTADNSGIVRMYAEAQDPRAAALMISGSKKWHYFDLPYTIISNASPTADAGPDKVITLPTTQVSVSGASATDSDGSIASIVWSFVSGPKVPSIAGNTTLSPTFSGLTTVGDYQFRLTVTDNEGATDSDTVKITVSPAPAPNLTSQNLIVPALTAGQLATLSAEVLNNGTAGTGVGFNDVFQYSYISAIGPWTEIGQTVKSPLSTGLTSPDTITFIPPTGGLSIFIRHCVDHGDQVPNETNESAADQCEVSAPVSVTANPPTVDIKVDDGLGGGFTDGPVQIISGGSVNLQWTVSGSVDVGGCVASGDWSGVKNESGGNETTATLVANAKYTLTCTGPGGSNSDTVDVSIKPQPNLRVPSSGSITPSSGWDKSTGFYDNAKIDYIVDNNGTADAGVFDIELKSEFRTNIYLPATKYVVYKEESGLNFGKSISRTTWLGNGSNPPGVPPGDWKAVITADYKNDVKDEISETDNDITVTGFGPARIFAPDPLVELTVDPDIVRYGESTNLKYRNNTGATYDMDCTIDGPSITTYSFNPNDPDPDLDNDGDPSTGLVPTGPITSKSEFFLKCIEKISGYNDVYTATAVVETTGIVEER